MPDDSDWGELQFEDVIDWGILDGEKLELDSDWRLEAQNAFDLGETEVRNAPTTALRNLEQCVAVISEAENNGALSKGEMDLRVRALRIALRLKVERKQLSGFSPMVERLFRDSDCIHSDCFELWKTILECGGIPNNCCELDAFFEASCELFFKLQPALPVSCNIQVIDDWIDTERYKVQCGLRLAKLFHGSKQFMRCTRILECLQQEPGSKLNAIIESVFIVFFAYNHIREMAALLDAFPNSTATKRASLRWKQFVTKDLLQAEMKRLREKECKEELDAIVFEAMGRQSPFDEWDMYRFAHLSWRIVETSPMPHATETQLRPVVIDTFRNHRFQGVHRMPQRWLKLWCSNQTHKDWFPLLWSDHPFVQSQNWNWFATLKSPATGCFEARRALSFKVQSSVEAVSDLFMERVRLLISARLRIDGQFTYYKLFAFNEARPGVHIDSEHSTLLLEFNPSLRIVLVLSSIRVKRPRC